ncbi:hypothetical protein BU24DRAFT_424328 [Aaosphaeria arxii CBS 175.79]|uniref:Dynactin-like protein subunit 2 n=1 Tax=Aaosphaeria arxii CBS 175.79 TaxID=1450172 RepID=A0A6A5XKB6_9PLEO|nr:uncharacterized protein BU24DRAFT_424328 [Aaosphaeria arxii CBS 175.79]KAF2013316.1 hypothetical protein BU24DRAFT_424328 [Aaosphaeria arxii CBS 175.79]
MAEASKPKYDSLPGIDTAPDVYETPELDNDTSTIQASTAVSDSDAGDSEEDEESTIRHRHLQTDEARSRFQPSRIDARGVDFSDNISAQRRSYRTSTRGARRRGEILGEDSDDEKESFSRKLLRLKRELHELEEEYEDRVQSGDKTQVEEKDPKEIMELISEKVDYIYAMRKGGVRGAEPILERTIEKYNKYPPFEPSQRLTKAIENQPPLPGSQVQRSQLEFVLNQAADFDTRLSKLEASLGLDGNSMPDTGENAPFPLYTTLEKLEQTVTAISDASTTNLEIAAQNVRKLITEADTLKQSKQDSLQYEGAASPPPNGKPIDAKSRADTDQDAKINALYGTLPSIDKLSPMLPIVLERLRTLRLVHTAAWQADEVLTELENRQSKQEDEIQKWATSLENVEKDVKECEQSLQQNMRTVGDWVKKLEERMENMPSIAQ